MFHIQIEFCAKNNFVMDMHTPLPRANSTVDGLHRKVTIAKCYKFTNPDTKTVLKSTLTSLQLAVIRDGIFYDTQCHSQNIFCIQFLLIY